jgi:hypothetical protein
MVWHPQCYFICCHYVHFHNHVVVVVLLIACAVRSVRAEAASALRDDGVAPLVLLCISSLRTISYHVVVVVVLLIACAVRSVRAEAASALRDGVASPVRL